MSAAYFAPASHLLQRVLARRRLADETEGGHRLHGHLLQMALDPPPLDELPVAHLRLGIADHRDDPILHLQTFCGHRPCLARHLEQHGAGFGRGATQDGAELPDAQGTEGAHVPGTEVRIAHDHVHPVQRHVQFLGEEHGQGRHGPLAQLHLAHQAGDAVIGTDPEVGVEVLGIARPGGGPFRLLRLEGTFEREPEHQAHGAGGQEEVAALHAAPPFRDAAASMASRMRTWEPQRQRFPSRCWRIWSRVGRGFLSSNA